MQELCVQAIEIMSTGTSRDQEAATLERPKWIGVKPISRSNDQYTVEA